jgi:nitrous oxide reductase accessory protein NosL
VTEEYAGVNPQEIIKNLAPGDELFLKRIPMEKHPKAVLVLNDKSDPVGWLPESEQVYEFVTEALDRDAIAKVYVDKITGGTGDDTFDITIDIEMHTYGVNA